MIGASLLVEGKEAYGEFGLNDGLRYEIEGTSAAGGTIGLDAAQIRWHGGVVDLAGGTKYDPVAIKEVDTSGSNHTRSSPRMSRAYQRCRLGRRDTGRQDLQTNKVFLDLLHYRNLATAPKYSRRAAGRREVPHRRQVHRGRSASMSRNGRCQATSSPGSSSSSPSASEVRLANIDMNFNSLDQRYLNTPKTMKIQTSADGVTWNDAGTVNGPTGTAISVSRPVSAECTGPVRQVDLRRWFERADDRSARGSHQRQVGNAEPPP